MGGLSGALIERGCTIKVTAAEETARQPARSWPKVVFRRSALDRQSRGR